MIKIDSIEKSTFDEYTDEYKRTLTFYLVGSDEELISFNKKYNGYFGDEYLIIDIDYSHGNMTEIKKDMKLEIKEFNRR